MRGFVDQIDVVKQFVAKYPTAFKFATSVADIEEAAASGRIASLIGVEGGHAIDSSLGSLRQLYDLGARYMTLTHTCNTPWYVVGVWLGRHSNVRCRYTGPTALWTTALGDSTASDKLVIPRHLLYIALRDCLCVCRKWFVR